jgi:hypothetical protein
VINERMILRELTLEWALLNRERFRGRMRAPVIALTDAEGLLGRWDLTHRTILMQRALFTSERYAEVIEILKHEMAHQFVHECLGIFDETAHGETFQRVCRDIGADARASGAASAAAPDGLLAKVAHLLALAESDNPHEAENAMVQAQRLIAKHNLVPIPHEARHYTARALGVPRGRVSEAERVVAKILVTHFFVDAIWISSLRLADGVRGSVLEVSGTRENVELAEYVHGFLHGAAERLWTIRTKSPGDRRPAFLAGVMSGFAEKLVREQKKQAAAGLVWLKDADLGHYFRRRHPRVRHVRYGGEARSRAFQDGVSEGAKLVLRRAIKDAGGGQVRGLLPKTTISS